MIVTPSQRCTADTRAGQQCGQRTAVGHLCWSHLQRDIGVRVKPSSVPDAGRGLYVARRSGLPKGHRIPYTGDEIDLTRAAAGGPYVLQTKLGTGIDAARRNAGFGRWVNDPRGAIDEAGRPLQANCEFALSTPPGGGQRIAAVRTLRPVSRGEELLVRYGSGYWRFHAAKRPSKGRGEAAAQRQRIGAPAQTGQRAHGAPASEPRAKDQRFEQVLVTTLAAVDAAQQPERGSARAGRPQRVQPERGSARAGRRVAAAPAADERSAVAAPPHPHRTRTRRRWSSARRPRTHRRRR